MARACGPTVPVQENPGALLGAVMGEMARVGRDKVTFLLSSDMATFGMWLEQLIAESTGKEGTGLLPVTGEPAGTPLVYGSDRFFVHIYMKGRSDARLEEAVRMLQTASLPFVFIEVAGAYAIAQEFFRWEAATAIAGAILGINPFDQPECAGEQGRDEPPPLLCPGAGLAHGAGPCEGARPLALLFQGWRGKPRRTAFSLPLTGASRRLRCDPGLSAGRTSTNELMQAIRLRLRDALGLATTVGYGPAFSTRRDNCTRVVRIRVFSSN